VLHLFTCFEYFSIRSLYHPNWNPFFPLKIEPLAENNGKSSNSPSQHSSILKIATFRNTEFVNLSFYETVDTNGDFVFRSFRAGQLVCLLFPHTNFKNVRFVLTTRKQRNGQQKTLWSGRCSRWKFRWETLKQKEFPRVGDLCSETQSSLTVNWTCFTNKQ